MQVRWKNTSAHSRVSRSTSTACYCSPILPTMRTQAKLPSLRSSTDCQRHFSSYGADNNDQFHLAAFYVDSAGRKACRSARTDADQVLPRDQPQDRQGTWHHSPLDVALDRRRGDRVGTLCCIALCRVLAQSGHARRVQQCPLWGVKRTSVGISGMSAYDRYC